MIEEKEKTYFKESLDPILFRHSEYTDLSQ